MIVVVLVVVVLGVGLAVGAGVLFFVAAPSIHAVVWLQYRGDPFAHTYVSDSLSYHLWAERIATDGLSEEPVFHQSPLFPLLLGALYLSVVSVRTPLPPSTMTTSSFRCHASTMPSLRFRNWRPTINHRCRSPNMVLPP